MRTGYRGVGCGRGYGGVKYGRVGATDKTKTACEELVQELMGGGAGGGLFWGEGGSLAMRRIVTAHRQCVDPAVSVVITRDDAD